MLPHLRPFVFICLTVLTATATTTTTTTTLRAQDKPNLTEALAVEQLTEAKVQERLDALKADKNLDTAVRKSAETIYADVLAGLRQLEAARARLGELRALERDAASLLDDARRERVRPIDASVFERETDDAVEAALAQAKAESARATGEAKEFSQKLDDLELRQKALPQLITDAQTRLDEANKAATASPLPDPMLEAARLTLARVRLAAAQIERDALQLELGTYDKANKPMVARQERAKLELKHTQQAISSLQQILQRRRVADARRMQTLAQRRLDQLGDRFPGLRRAAAANLERAKTWRDIQERLPALTKAIKTARDSRKETQEKFDTVRQMLRLGVQTQTTGNLLRQHKSRLPDVTRLRLRGRDRDAESSGIRLAQMDLGEQLQVDKEQFIAEARSPGATAEASEAGFDELAQEVYAERQSVLRSLQREYNDRLTSLGELETEELQLASVSRTFLAYIDEKILWVRSTSPIWSAEWSKATTALPISTLDRVLPALLDGVSSRWPTVVLGGLALLLLGCTRRRQSTRLIELGVRAKKSGASAFAPTVLALTVTVVLAMPMPLLLLLGFDVTSTLEVTRVLGTGVSDACLAAAQYLLPLEILRAATRQQGLAENHLDWPPRATEMLRRHLFLAVVFGIPALFLVRLGDSSDAARSLLSRPLFMVSWLVAAVLLGRLLRPGRGVLGPDSGWKTPPVRSATRRILALVAVAIPVCLAGMAAGGYFFTARQLSARFLATIAVLFGLILVAAMVSRWSLVSRRRIAQAQRRVQAEALRRERAAEAASASPTDDQPPAPSAPAPVAPLDVDEVSIQTRRLVRTALVLSGTIAVFGIWSPVLPALGALREVELWSATQTVVEEITVKDGATLLESRDRMVPITLADLLLCLITVIMTTVGAKNIPGLLKLSVLQRVRPGNQYAVATLTQYAIVLVGTIMAFSAIGIGWSKVQWLLAAVSLGLGFGLQEIFANFVSGLIILFEQPIRVGDFVTVGDVSGEVTRIRIRATTVRNLQRQELIVPNKSFITGQIINWTLTDTINRIVIHVGIAYGSDVDLARSILLRVAKENKYVVAEPTPKAIFKQFADSALLFELRIFINNLDHWPRALDSMHSAIDAEFRKAGVEIAFPQQDIHLRSVQATLPIEMDQGDVVDDPQHIDAKRRTSSS